MFPRYVVHPGASTTVCCAAPPLDVCGYAARRCAPNPRMNTYARPAEGAKNQKPRQDQKPDQEPLTLALSRRERGLTGVLGRTTPTCDTESKSGFEKAHKSAPSPSGEGWAGGVPMRGKSTTNSKPTTPCSSPLNRMSVSSAAALDLDPQATSAGFVQGLIRGGSAATVWRSQTQREEVQRSHTQLEAGRCRLFKS